MTRWRRLASAQRVLGGLLLVEAVALVIGSYPEGGPGLAVVPPIVLWGIVLSLLARPLGRGRRWAAIVSVVLVGGPGAVLGWLAAAARDGNEASSRAQVVLFDGVVMTHAAACIGLAALVAHAIRRARLPG